jgi:hypothetical protein
MNMKKVFTLFLLLLCVATGWAGVDPTPTTDIESGTYVIKAFSSKNETGGYVFLDNSNAYADANTKNFEELIYKTYLWTVTKNTDGSITITSFSDATKSFPANPSNTQTFTLNNTAGSYTLQPAGDSYPNCFYLKIGSHYVYANGSSGNNNLGFWNAQGGPAVKACFYKATTDKVSVTYKYTHNGKTLKTVTGQWGGGFPYPKLLELPDYVTSTLPEGTVPNEDVTKEIPVTWNDMPFKENQWYFVKLGCVTTTSQNGYLYDKNDNATQIDMGVTTKDLSTTNYLWKFEGDPFNGYTLTSAYGHKLVTPAVSGNGGTTFAYAASTAPTNGFDTWVVYKPTTAPNVINNKGFFLAVKDHATWKLNSRTVPNTTTNALSFWTEGSGDGSGIFVDAALPEITLNTLNDKNYATYYLPFAAKAPEGVTAYAGTINNGNVQLTEYANGVIPANKGVVLVSDTKTTATFTLADASEVKEQTNELTGVLTDTELSNVDNAGQVRIFSKKDNVAGFYKPNSGITTLAANKAYIMAPTNEGALVLNFAGGEVTDINQATINATEANAPIYDLTGRRVAKAVKGIYVKNGKKFIVK